MGFEPDSSLIRPGKATVPTRGLDPTIVSGRRAVGLTPHPLHGEGDDLAEAQAGHEVIELDGAMAPAVDPDVGRSPDLLEPTVRVTVEMDRSLAVPAPASKGIVGADHAGPAARPAEREQVVHRVEEPVEVGVDRIMVSPDEDDPLDRESLADPPGLPDLGLP